MFKNFSKDTIKVYNSFLLTSFDMTSQEFDIVCFFISCIQSSRNKERDINFFTYKISIKEFQKKFSKRLNYEAFKESILKLSKKEIFMDSNKLKLTEICEINDNNEVSFKFHEDMKDFFIISEDCDKNFTTFSLKNILKLKGVYTKRLYILFEQFSSTMFCKIDFKSICNRFCVHESYSKNFNNFEKKILKYSVEQIKEVMNLESFFYIVHKKGVRIDSFDLIGSRNVNVQIVKKRKQNLKEGVIALEKWFENKINK